MNYNNYHTLKPYRRNKGKPQECGCFLLPISTCGEIDANQSVCICADYGFAAFENLSLPS